MVSRRIEGLQKKVEERNFDSRKNLLEYDEVMDEQRKRVYSFRQRLLDGEPAKDGILHMIDTQIKEVRRPLPRRRLRRGELRRVWPGRGRLGVEPHRQALQGALLRGRRGRGLAGRPSRRPPARSARPSRRAFLRRGDLRVQLAGPRRLVQRPVQCQLEGQGPPQGRQVRRRRSRPNGLGGLHRRWYSPRSTAVGFLGFRPRVPAGGLGPAGLLRRLAYHKPRRSARPRRLGRSAGRRSSSGSRRRLASFTTARRPSSPSGSA